MKNEWSHKLKPIVFSWLRQTELSTWRHWFSGKKHQFMRNILQTIFHCYGLAQNIKFSWFPETIAERHIKAFSFDIRAKRSAEKLAIDYLSVPSSYYLFWPSIFMGVFAIYCGGVMKLLPNLLRTFRVRVAAFRGAYFPVKFSLSSLRNIFFMSQIT